MREGLVGVVGDDHPHRHEAVVVVIEARVGLRLPGVAGFGGDGDMLLGVRIVHRGHTFPAGSAGLGLRGFSARADVIVTETSGLRQKQGSASGGAYVSIILFAMCVKQRRQRPGQKQCISDSAPTTLVVLVLTPRIVAVFKNPTPESSS